MPKVIAAMENLESLAKDLNIKIHSLLSAAPQHVSFIVLEAESPAAIAGLLTSVPFEQDFKVDAVLPEQELIAMAKEMMAAG